MFKFEHLRLKENFSDKVEKVEGVFRVGFLAVMINKTKDNKGVFWQKYVIEQVPHNGQTEEEQLQQFQQVLEAKVIEEERKKRELEELREK